MKIIDESIRFLIRLVIVLVVLLVVVQGLMTDDKARFYLSFDERIDGQPIKIPAIAKHVPAAGEAKPVVRTGIVTLELADYTSLDKATVLVNGRERDGFHNGKVNLQVEPEDLIEIDTTSYNKTVRVKVTEVSNNIVFPHQGIIVDCEQAITLLGEIKIR